MDKKKSKNYNRIKLTLSISDSIINLVFVLVLLFCGFSVKMDHWISGLIGNEYLALFFFLFLLGILSSIITFPVGFCKDYLLEHRYKLSNQTIGQYFLEKAKGMMVVLPILLVMMSIFYFVLKNRPESWWIIFGTVIVFFSVLLSRLAPTLIFPLFYKFSELDNSDLREKIENLCNQTGMNLEGVFRFDMSKNTQKANAAFTGIGKSKRIILGDTLLGTLEDDEILAVLAHELGHFKRKHIWKGMFVGVLLNYLGLFLVDEIYTEYFLNFGPEKHSLAALPLIALLLSIFGMITGPLTNILSRKHEREADAFAAKFMQSPGPLISGLNKLSRQNLGDDDPHPVVEFLFYSHPSTRKRIERLSAFGLID
ncbi:MAG: M48 family metallopeptidase [Candidatus Marinimicrobia bacterium]|nr:M48 family metallopeptidase [Candidatus Neomarinimicrobiota bacterium]